MTKLTTLGFGVARTIQETTQTGASGYFDAEFDASVDHELLRNLILGARAGISFQEYEGIDRNDEVAKFAISGKYLLSRNFTFSYATNIPSVSPMPQARITTRTS